MKYVPLPSPGAFERIPPEHWFEKIIRTGQSSDIQGVYYDETRITNVSVTQSWDTEIGRARTRESMARKIADGRVQGLSLEALEEAPPPEPFTTLSITLLDDSTLSWNWWGDGGYDGFDQGAAPGKSLNDPDAPTPPPIPEA